MNVKSSRWLNLNREKTVNRYPAIVVARMNSQRLAGKGLREVAGKKLIQYVVDTLSVTDSVSEIVIATSNKITDDPLAKFAKQSRLRCVRGSLQDVANRFALAIRETKAEAAYRVNGDSPFISRQLFEQAADELSHEMDLVTNVFPRTYPPGLSVELIRAKAFQRALKEMTSDADREHVTRYLYSNASCFQIKNLESTADYANCHLAVDTKHDFLIFEAMVDKMDRPHWQYTPSQLVNLYHLVAKSVGS